MSFFSFLTDNYIWIMIALLVLVIGVIGFLVDSKKKKVGANAVVNQNSAAPVANVQSQTISAVDSNVSAVSNNQLNGVGNVNVDNPNVTLTNDVSLNSMNNGVGMSNGGGSVNPQVAVPQAPMEPVNVESQVAVPQAQMEPVNVEPQVAIPQAQMEPVNVEPQVAVPQAQMEPVNVEPQVAVPQAQMEPVNVEPQVAVPQAPMEPVNVEPQVAVPQAQMESVNVEPQVAVPQSTSETSNLVGVDGVVTTNGSQPFDINSMFSNNQ